MHGSKHKNPAPQPASAGSFENPRLTAALEYARRNWPVIALHTPEGQSCSCGEVDCGGAAKHPRYHRESLPSGLKSATTDVNLIQTWWKLWPEANVAIVTGAFSGLLVLDVDPRHGGEESLEELEAKHGRIPDTMETITGGGGRHILFAHPGGVVGNKVGLVPGLDVRGDGGYIVAPPSLHMSGNN
jgi:hypothetical protein